MNEKLSLQNIADALAQKAGVSKKVSEQFTKAFFDTIVEALYMGEDSIKVKGLGIFKLVTVGSRESVNVSNGERIVISGYKKVSFTPEESVVDFLNSGADVEEVTLEEAAVAVPVVVEPEVEMPSEGEPLEKKAPVEEAKVEKAKVEVPKAEEAPVEEAKVEEPVAEEPSGEKVDIDEMIAVAEPTKVELPQNEFAGIDMLISTPESIEEVRQQYAEAKARMEAAVEEARKANVEKVRLEKLLERLESNAVPEVVIPHVEDVATGEVPEVTDTKEEEAVPEAPQEADAPKSEEERRREALERLVSGGETPDSSTPTPVETDRKPARWLWISLLAVVLAGIIAFFLYQSRRSIDSVCDVEKVEAVDKQKPVKHQVPAKPVAKPVAKPAVKPVAKPVAKPAVKPVAPAPKANNKAKTPKRPATHIMEKGESLTRISQAYYGTKDSVGAIIRANKFPDPNNVPVGAVVKLP